jgi:hypothetical protein
MILCHVLTEVLDLWIQYCVRRHSRILADWKRACCAFEPDSIRPCSFVYHQCALTRARNIQIQPAIYCLATCNSSFILEVDGIVRCHLKR